jgi:glucans biosynthesis protein C
MTHTNSPRIADGVRDHGVPADSGRRNELDWLRLFAIAGVFLFHSGRFFDRFGWHVKNAESSELSTFFTELMVQWLMPLFFLISGASTWHSLQKRGVGIYAKDRVIRLLVPLVFGIFVIVPPQVYLERFTRNEFSGSFLQFFPHYFDGWYAFGGNFAWMGLHLWYLLVLFVFSFALLPFFLFLKRQKALQKTALFSCCRQPLAIYVLALPVTVLELTLDPRGIGMKDFGGWNLFAYLIVFGLGYLLYSDARCLRTIQDYRKRSLGCGLVLLTILIGLRQTGIAQGNLHWLDDALRGFHSWFWLLTIVGFAIEHLNRKPRWLGLANELVMPFYIWHQTVILVIGFYIVRLEHGILAKFALICALSLPAILLLCGFVARFNVLRFLFGMRPQTRSRSDDLTGARRVSAVLTSECGGGIYDRWVG